MYTTQNTRWVKRNEKPYDFHPYQSNNDFTKYLGLSKALSITLCLIFSISIGYALPKGFVYLEDIESSIIQDMRYASDDNFVGHPIDGYDRNRCILTQKAAIQLAKLQQKMKEKGLGLKVYDCYRPKRAVRDFMRWSRNSNKRMKSYYYPREYKRLLFQKGYIAAYSAHSRGSTVDITLVSQHSKMKKGVPTCYSNQREQDGSLDMGTNFDCLDVSSHYAAKDISQEAQDNRVLLRKMMKKVGFRPYNKEWWHFTLRNEPYPRQYFNFIVK